MCDEVARKKVIDRLAIVEETNRKHVRRIGELSNLLETSNALVREWRFVAQAYYKIRDIVYAESTRNDENAKT